MKDKKGANQIFDKEIWCTEYAPDVFAQLRSIDGFTKEHLEESLNLEVNEKQV